MKTRVLAFDPGGTTGWAMWTADVIDGPDGREVLNGHWQCGQLGPEEHHAKLEYFIEASRVQDYHVVYESFEFRQKTRDNVVLISKEYIGVIKLVCIREEIPFTAQTAAMGKGFVTDDKIKKLDLWHPGWKHAMDAYRHLLYYLTFKEPHGLVGHELLRKWH